MKRSEMINILSVLIKESIYVNENNGQLIVDREEVGFILDQLTYYGMLPPSYTVKEKRVGPCWEVEVDTTVNKWEDE